MLARTLVIEARFYKATDCIERASDRTRDLIARLETGDLDDDVLYLVLVERICVVASLKYLWKSAAKTLTPSRQ
jgi:hypothetical protein